jgi:hypothetical protein
VETEQKKEGITPYRVVPSHILQLLGLIKMPGERKHFMLFFFFLLTTYPLFSNNYFEKAFEASFLSLVFFFFWFNLKLLLGIIVMVYWAKKTNNQELVETVSTIIWTKIDLRFSFLTKRLFINQSIVGFQ